MRTVLAPSLMLTALLVASTAVPAAARCYQDFEQVSVRGTASRQSIDNGDGTARSAWMLTMAEPLCVAPPDYRPEVTLSQIQIVGFSPEEGVTMELTGKLVFDTTAKDAVDAVSIVPPKKKVLSPRRKPKAVKA
jgi:hypothetical protein